jgi:predicted nucleotidyltransferase
MRFFFDILTENIEPNKAEPINEMDCLYNDMIAEVDIDAKIPKDVINSFKIKDELCPEIWNNQKLKPEVKTKLAQIANDFFNQIDIKKPKFKDILFIGSLTNFNWSKFSDIDLHIIIDFETYDSNEKVITDYFKTKKVTWQEEHLITIYDFPIEIYVQDAKAKNHSPAAYSLMQDKWINKPEQQTFKLDVNNIKNKVKKLHQQLMDVKADYDNAKYDPATKKAISLRDKIYNMRKSGLESGGELSTENIVFKVLRRTQFMDYLFELINKSYDKKMSIS